MSELQHYFDEYCRGGAWRDPDAKRCGCLGRGWFLSKVDTYHFKGQRHPEDYDSEEELTADMEATRLEVFTPTAVVAPVDDDDIPF